MTFAHYTDEWKDALEEGKKKTTHEVIVLRDGQAVQVIDGKHSVVGKSS